MPIYDGSANGTNPSKGLPGDSQGNPGQVFPENAVASPWKRLEPLMTVTQLKSRFLFGIPLISRFKDPDTGKPMKMTDEMLADYINRSVSEAEVELGIDIMPIKYSEKLPFDRCEYQCFGYFRTVHRPICTIDQLSVRPSNNRDVFIVPNDWIETANMAHGQINIMPLTLATTSPQGVVNSQGGGGGVFLNILGQERWVPAYWGIEYTTGFRNGEVPQVINDYMGMVAAMKILSLLAATWSARTSASLGIDGLSQSVGTPGPNIFAIRIGELEKERNMLKGKIKKVFMSKLVVGNV